MEAFNIPEPVRSNTTIEPAEASTSDTDSTYDERTLSTASVTSSIYNHTKENGRTYHAYRAEKNYAFPNDQAEQQRMDIHYHSLRFALFDNIFFAPIEVPLSILDMGTGTGIWAIDAADAYPAAEVLGIDLSPIQPAFVPPNCSFQIMDLDDQWEMPCRFDLIHTREMNGFCVKSWPAFYKQAFESLRPGGWVECQEFDFNIISDDDTIPKDSAVIRWQTLWENGARQGGITARCYPTQMKSQMEEQGFINVEILPFKMPIGPWPKDKTLKASGLYTLAGLLDGLSGISLRVFTGILGWSQEQMEELLDEVRAELKNKKIHSYFPISVVYAQKPFDSKNGECYS